MEKDGRQVRAASGWGARAVLAAAVAAVAGLQLVQPWLIMTAVAVCAVLLAVFRRPMLGIYLQTALYPLQTCLFQLRIFRAQSLQPNLLEIYPIEVLNLFLLPMLLLQLLARRHRAPRPPGPFPHRPYAWYGYAAAFFVAWSLLVALRADNLPAALVGWWRLMSALVTMACLIAHVDRADKLVRVLVCYSVVAVVFALAAIAATHFAFSTERLLLHTERFTVYGVLSLFNQTGRFFAPVVGMVAGYGLAAKHELTMLMLGGSAFLACLVYQARRPAARALGVLALLLVEAVKYQAFSRLSIFGSIAVLGGLCLCVAPWRRQALTFAAVYALVNVVAFAGASALRPAHEKAMQSTRSRLANMSTKSQFEPSSLAGRMRYWKRTSERIALQRGLGTGPDSLNRDIAFAAPHGHNWVLTFSAEDGVPAMLCVVAVLLLTARRAHRLVFRRPRVRDPLWLLRITLVAGTLSALFEYSFDVLVHDQQLWFMLALLLAALHNLPATTPGTTDHETNALPDARPPVDPAGAAVAALPA